MAIADYFNGKHIFITGGSGFLGKILIEKLLRSCPGLGNIYMLLRAKKDLSIEDRLEKIKSLPLFDLLKKKNPDALKKIIPVKGDVCELNLGLTEADRRLLVEKVNIIYHTAASVRFDDFLTDAIILNVRGTREVAQLALDLKHISLFVHVSTTYCNCDKFLVEEKLYPPHADWRESIKLAEEGGEDVLNALTVKYIQPLPNTYTFAKSLAEHVVNDLCKDKIPAVIVRPSVVINTIHEPIEGWNDNFNGPVGLLTAGGKGLLRTILGNREARVDYIPVDFVIKGILVITHANGSKNHHQEVEVYNISQNHVTTIKQAELLAIGKELVQNSPFSIVMWYPRFFMTHCWYNFYIQVLLFHMVPAFLLDIMLRATGKTPMLFNLQRKIYSAVNVLNPFLSNTFTFVNHKLWNIQKSIETEDYAFAFKVDPLTREEISEYFKNCKIGTALYILKEKFDFSAIESKKRIKRFWYADVTVKTSFFAVLFWIFFYKINIFTILLKQLKNYIDSLE